MKNIVFFITHKTLSEKNCELTFKSLNNQEGFLFDVFYIYNTHQSELPNETVINLYNTYNLNRFFKTYKIFNYNENTPKTIAWDVKTICDYVLNTYSQNDRVLFLKSDILLSKNYFSVLKTLTNEFIYFTSPLVNAKKRVPDDEILEYILRPSFIKSDDITFYVEDEFQSNNNDFTNRPRTNITDHSIKYFSCDVMRDWSCHFISINLLHHLILVSQSWGGVNLQKLYPYFIKTDKCFTVHKYHNIKSENRILDREGPVEQWLLS